jgi:hypothetical protein
MKYFTPTIDKYFAAWVLRDTWDSGHPLDMQNFYRFVRAIDHFSKAIRRSPLDLNDPILSNYPEKLWPKFAKTSVGFDRNPRTYDEDGLKKKIVLAVRRNHENLSKTYVEEQAVEFVKRAMLILDVLWAWKQMPFPDQKIQKWEPDFK